MFREITGFLPSLLLWGLGGVALLAAIPAPASR
jgi:hypothetical protein